MDVDLMADDELEPDERQAMAGAVTALMDALERFCERSGLGLWTEVLEDVPEHWRDEVERIVAFTHAGRVDRAQLSLIEDDEDDDDDEYEDDGHEECFGAHPGAFGPVDCDGKAI